MIKHKIRGISLFSNVGISETYFLDNGVEIVIANELLKNRCDFYSHLYPHSEMVVGDITKKDIFNKLVSLYNLKKCNFLIATPPCQGMSVAGKMKKDDERNKLIIQVVEFIKLTEPENIIIENVPGILKFSILVNNCPVKIVDYIRDNLSPLGYKVNYGILDAADYETPQYRKRAIFLISKIGFWDFPSKHKHISVREVIGDLPSLESGQKSNIKNHYAKVHNHKHILWMKNTPTGKTAFDNKIYFPEKDGRRIKGFSTTYKRIGWDKPAPTITMCNGAISSQNNVHPGRKLPDGTYSDARVLSILELQRLMGLPDDWNIPHGLSEEFVRKVLGEAFPPKFAANLLKTMPRNK
ncbi:MAG TPA: DNA cytosine methyltransferase [Candidatus Paceibacterota bacterium]|nr:DNA cytosine methyltransferase [Saprospiraceae bacterium]HMP85138.1 DNA cytosine methyltransferase [Candidatus Paceibacterota bacterium]